MDVGLTEHAAIYVDGELVGSGTASTGHASKAGNLLFGQDQDSSGASMQLSLSGTLYDVRIWNEVRSEAEISLNYQHKFDSGSLPSGLVANWQMDGFNGSNQVVDVVSGNNLSIGHATGTGFIASTPVGDLHIGEHAVDGSSVGYVVPSDPDAVEDLSTDGLFLGAGDPSGNPTFFSDGSGAGSALGDWTVTNGSVDLIGNMPIANGGSAVDLNGSTPGAISQAFATEAGRQYQIVFDVTGNFSGGAEAIKTLRVTADGVSNDFAVEQPNGWSFTTNPLFETRSMMFAAQDASTLISFAGMNSDNYGAVITNVRVLEIPDAITKILNNDPTLSYDAATGKFYRFVNDDVSWTVARDAALAASLNGVNGQLVTINSAYENELLRNLTNVTGKRPWLGATDQTVEGEWRWQNEGADGNQFWQGNGTTGNAISGQYTNWNLPNPQATSATDDYAILLGTGQWADREASDTQSYVIEWDASEVLSSFTFSLTDDAGGRFAIDSNTGEITVADGSLLDYESATSLNVTVQVTDAAGNSYSEVMAIAVDNGVEPVINGLTQNYVGQLQSHSPLIHLRLGETSGTTAFDSAGSNDGTYQGGVVLGSGGAINGDSDTSVTFSDSQYIQVAHSPDFLIDEGTVQLWFKTSDITQEGTLFSKDASGYGSGGHLTAEVLTNGEIQVRLQSTSSQHIVQTDNVSQAISENEWHHFAFSFGSAGMKLYIDGQLMDTNAYTGGMGTSSGGSGNTEALLIGAGNTFSDAGTTNTINRYYAGEIDEFAIISGQLSDAEVQSLVTSTNDNSSVTIDEDTTHVFSAAGGNAITVSDTVGTINSRMRVTLSVNDGVLTLSQTTGLTIVEGSNGSGSLVIDGTESDINAAFEGMTFTPDADFNGSVTLNMSSALAADLEGHYTFEGGNANDQAAGAADNGTLNGDATTVIDPERGEVLSLDGSGDYVQVTGNFGAPANVTLSAWIHLDSPGVSGSDVINVSNNLYLRVSNTSGLTAGYYNGTAFQTLASNIALTGTGWRHVAFTFNDATHEQNLYIDGELVASGNHTDSIVHGGSGVTRIGADDVNTNYDFGGMIDDARVYSRALSADEIAALANDDAFVSDTVSITVNAVNDAPVLTVLPGPFMTSISEDDTNNTGMTVADLLLTQMGGNPISDVDSGAVEGIAITATTSGNGTWQYSTNGGSSWSSVGTVSDNSALPLRDSDRVRFVPDGQNATTGDITFRAWDQTGATAGQQGTKGRRIDQRRHDRVQLGNRSRVDFRHGN
ncbi:MAG: LamG-like jellyroll fold domain-containing protein [Pirellulaceae bacterium]